MRVQPNASKSIGCQALIDAGVEVVGHRVIVKADADQAGHLGNGDEFLNIERPSGSGDAEAADFSVTPMTKVLEFQPRQTGKRSGPAGAGAGVCMEFSVNMSFLVGWWNWFLVAG